MARPRLPVAKAATGGAAVKNPGRHAGRKKPKGTRALGEPYKTMTAAQKRAWAEFEREMPWLNASHRVLLRLACFWTAKMDDPEADFGVSATQALSSILSKLGATPVDESKVSHGTDEDDPDDEFFGGAGAGRSH
ncbi:hypothetical protein [Stenotrophomonas sp.]|uniref:hypothetical protein n=1 Tax=Stenotrophomonas sp. TaxID=69392 RepID=UPI00289DAC22|nr:hypothetical protein [Stenotrophomonas sp.]